MQYKTKLLITIPNLYGGTGTFCRNLVFGLKKYFPDEYYIELLALDNNDFRNEDKELFDNVSFLFSIGFILSEISATLQIYSKFTP